MPSSSIAQILLRLFALNWFLMGVAQVVSMTLTFRGEHFQGYQYAQSVTYLVAGAIVWFVAPRVSHFLTQGNDGEFELKGLTDEQLYSAIFLGLGLYFTLSHFAVAFTWIHFFTAKRSDAHGFDINQQPSYYDLSETLMMLAAGIYLIFTCKTWARKLASKRTGESA